MIENLRSSTEKKLNQLQKAWAHLSKKQKLTLGVLTFVVVVLPLSLFLVKTQTNIFPKALTPITAPITSPYPSPVVCSEQCPGSDGVLRSCTPPESDGTSQDSLCGASFVGRTESCGNVVYCCDGNQWTTNLSSCPDIRPTPIPSPDTIINYCGRCSYLPNHQGAPNLRCADGMVCGPDESLSCSIDPATGEEVCATGISAFGRCVNPGENIAVCRNYASPSPTPSPDPGCFYQQVQCFQAPCDPILVCPSPSPVPAAELCQACNTTNFPGTTYIECVDGLNCEYNEGGCTIDDNGYQLCYDPMPGLDGKCVNPGENIDACQNNNPISLAGPTLPEDPRISFTSLDVNELLLSQSTLGVTRDTHLNDQDLAVEDGYGEFYMFYLQSPIEYEILARELDINTQGSYIRTVLYGADKRKINAGDTRIHHQANGNGPYYLVVHTFDHKQGGAQITILNKFRKYLYPFVKRIDQEMQPLLGGSKMGRKPADFFLQVPLIVSISDNYITYEYQNDENQLQTEIPRVVVTQTCPLTQQSQTMSVGVRKFNNPNQEPLREIRMKIYPQVSNIPDGGAYYPPGYDYTVNLEYPNPNHGWTTYFSTTSQSGLMADLNDDNAVDISDYGLLVSEFMQTTTTQSPNYLYSDLNCDNIVDISDYSLLIGNISL